MLEKPLIIEDADVVSRCRSITKPGSYSILPRANRVLSTIPGFKGTSAQVLVAPPLAVRFVEYELLVQPDGGTEKTICQEYEQFLYVLEGGIEFKFGGKSTHFTKGGYAWLPPRSEFSFVNKTDSTSRVLWLRRKYVEVPGLSVPAPIISSEQAVKAFPEDTYMEQHLIPYENPAFDLGINLLNFNPGVYFGGVESHIMEHGMYQLAGRGIYWLNGDYHEIRTDDFIYMAPFCPQFFYATGWEGSRYLIYKDVNRDYSVDL